VIAVDEMAFRGPEDEPIDRFLRLALGVDAAGRPRADEERNRFSAELDRAGELLDDLATHSATGAVRVRGNWLPADPT
jgi:hypothetical protein